jgi:hypothetical protein
MSEAADRQPISSRVVRSSDIQTKKNEWLSASPAERIEAVWTLTLAASGWNKEGFEEPRLDRSTTRVIRSKSKGNKEKSK